MSASLREPSLQTVLSLLFTPFLRFRLVLPLLPCSSCSSFVWPFLALPLPQCRPFPPTALSVSSSFSPAVFFLGALGLSFLLPVLALPLPLAPPLRKDCTLCFLSLHFLRARPVLSPLPRSTGFGVPFALPSISSASQSCSSSSQAVPLYFLHFLSIGLCFLVPPWHACSTLASAYPHIRPLPPDCPSLLVPPSSVSGLCFLFPLGPPARHSPHPPLNFLFLSLALVLPTVLSILFPRPFYFKPALPRSPSSSCLSPGLPLAASSALPFHSTLSSSHSSTSPSYSCSFPSSSAFPFPFLPLPPSPPRSAFLPSSPSPLLASSSSFSLFSSSPLSLILFVFHLLLFLLLASLCRVILLFLRAPLTQHTYSALFFWRKSIASATDQ